MNDLTNIVENVLSNRPMTMTARKMALALGISIRRARSTLRELERAGKAHWTPRWVSRHGYQRVWNVGRKR